MKNKIKSRFKYFPGVLLAALGLVWLVGCDTAGDPLPLPEGPQFSFFPQVDTLGVISTGYTDFQVVATPPVTFNVAWTLDDVPVGVGQNFRFFPPDLGTMCLKAHATYEGQAADCRWDLTVTNDHSLIFYFDPPDPDVSLVQLQTKQFQVYHDWPFARSFRWYRHGQVAGQDSTYLFAADFTGPDSLRVEVEAGDQIFSMDWNLTVTSYQPPAVQEVLARDGLGGGSVEVIWQAVVPVIHPVSGYLVAASFDGPITVDNWDDAIQVGPIDHVPELTWIRTTLTEPEHGMIPGANGWFAVRSVGAQDILSDIVTNAQHSLTNNWWIEGVVTDELGNALAGVELSDEDFLYATQTDAAGWYRIGPFVDNRTAVLRTHSADEDLPGQPGTSWHDYRTGALTMEAHQNLDLNLITRYGADPDCPANEGSFVAYFRYMTRTSIITELRPDFRLYKWEHYPLSVYIPEYIGDTSIDFQMNCALTLDMWNTNLGEEYLVQVGDPDLADVVFIFGDQGSSANGQTSLLEPAGQAYLLGDVIPEKMQVYIHNTLDEVQRVQETSLHELGHVLGMNRHSLCSQPGYLMYVTAAGALDNGPENAIHIDELRAVRTIRYLPQGYDMGGF